MSLFTKIRRARKTKERKAVAEWGALFDSLDNETRQETTLSYLRAIDNRSLARLYQAVELYRKADKILREKVRDPEPEPEDQITPTLQPEDIPLENSAQDKPKKKGEA